MPIDRHHLPSVRTQACVIGAVARRLQDEDDGDSTPSSGHARCCAGMARKRARADGPTNSQTRGARVTICSGRPGPPQRTSDLPKLRKREMVSFTARLRGMGTGISEASKGVPIFSFATQGGKQEELGPSPRGSDPVSCRLT